MSTKKAQAAFIRRTLRRLYERGLNARTLMLMELAQEAVDAEHSDVFFRYVDPSEPRATRKDAVAGYQELLQERDFGSGLAEDLWETCMEYGFPRVSADEKQRLALHWCFVGRQSYAHEREGV